MTLKKAMMIAYSEIGLVHVHEEIIDCAGYIYEVRGLAGKAVVDYQGMDAKALYQIPGMDVNFSVFISSKPVKTLTKPELDEDLKGLRIQKEIYEQITRNIEAAGK